MVKPDVACRLETWAKGKWSMAGKRAHQWSWTVSSPPPPPPPSPTSPLHPPLLAHAAIQATITLVLIKPSTSFFFVCIASAGPPPLPLLPTPLPTPHPPPAPPLTVLWSGRLFSLLAGAYYAVLSTGTRTAFLLVKVPGGFVHVTESSGMVRLGLCTWACAIIYTQHLYCLHFELCKETHTCIFGLAVKF